MTGKALFKLRLLSFAARRSQLLSPTSMQWRLSHQETPSLSKLSYRRFSVTLASHADLVVKVPPMAESISEGTLATIHKQVGDRIEADEELASIETDKIDVAVNVSENGVIAELFAQEGDTVTIGQPIARIETGPIDEKTTKPEKQSSIEAKEDVANNTQRVPQHDKSATPRNEAIRSPTSTELPVTLLADAQPNGSEQTASLKHDPSSRSERVEKMSRMRKTIATRLKQSQNTCASLTTIQEIDMTALMQWRVKYKEEIAKQYGIRLGYMGAFAKATALAAKQIPEINASIDTDREVITYRDYVDISIAVSSPKGLVTPVVRNCDLLSIVELEREIALVAQKARGSKLTMDDLTGGNFSISNPGIFNSLFGTPVINYPQAAVFNMNTINDRVVAINGKAEIRPMMYITVTYDHRLIDGREAVSFLNIVKRYIEDPARMLLE